VGVEQRGPGRRRRKKQKSKKKLPSSLASQVFSSSIKRAPVLLVRASLEPLQPLELVAWTESYPERGREEVASGRSNANARSKKSQNTKKKEKRSRRDRTGGSGAWLFLPREIHRSRSLFAVKLTAVAISSSA
jgi:hypothetical protein